MLECLKCLGAGLASVLCSPHGSFDQRLALVSRLRALKGKHPHFVGYHRESLSGFPGAGRFHCRVKGKDVGLERDIINKFNHIGDLLGRFVDLIHRFDQKPHLGVAVLHILPHGLGKFRGMAHLNRVFHHQIPGLVAGGVKLVDGICLSGGAVRQGLAGVGDVLGRGSYGHGDLNDLGKHKVIGLHQMVQIFSERVIL